LVWAVLAITAGVVVYTHSDQLARVRAYIGAFRNSRSAKAEATPGAPPESPAETPSPLPAIAPQVPDGASASSSIQVVVTAVQAAWVQLSADGKTSFTGMLMPNERKEISAVEQVKIVAGNAGGLTVSLNGKPLEPLGPVGQVRVVRLTAEGPEFLQVSHPPAGDPGPL
jgi:hypothetical protein